MAATLSTSLRAARCDSRDRALRYVTVLACCQFDVACARSNLPCGEATDLVVASWCLAARSASQWAQVGKCIETEELRMLLAVARDGFRERGRVASDDVCDAGQRRNASFGGMPGNQSAGERDGTASRQRQDLLTRRVLDEGDRVDQLRQCQSRAPRTVRLRQRLLERSIPENPRMRVAGVAEQVDFRCGRFAGKISGVLWLRVALIT